MMCIHHVMKYQ